MLGVPAFSPFLWSSAVLAPFLRGFLARPLPFSCCCSFRLSASNHFSNSSRSFRSSAALMPAARSSSKISAKDLREAAAARAAWAALSSRFCCSWMARNDEFAPAKAERVGDIDADRLLGVFAAIEVGVLGACRGKAKAEGDGVAVQTALLLSEPFRRTIDALLRVGVCDGPKLGDGEPMFDSCLFRENGDGVTVPETARSPGEGVACV